MSVAVERPRPDAFGSNKRTSIYDSLGAITNDLENLDLIETPVPSTKRPKTMTQTTAKIAGETSAPLPPPLRYSAVPAVNPLMATKRKALHTEPTEAPKRQCQKAEDESPAMQQFNFDNATQQIYRHILSKIEQQVDPTTAVIPVKDLELWIKEGVNASLNPLLSDIQTHLLEQITRLEQFYSRTWAHTDASQHDVSYIS